MEKVKKWQKVAKIGEKWEKMATKKCGKVVKRGEKLDKVGKSGKKWEKWLGVAIMWFYVAKSG